MATLYPDEDMSRPVTHNNTLSDTQLKAQHHDELEEEWKLRHDMEVAEKGSYYFFDARTMKLHESASYVMPVPKVGSFLKDTCSRFISAYSRYFVIGNE